MQMNRTTPLLLAIALICFCGCSGKYEESVLWEASSSRLDARLLYRGHHGANDGEVVLNWGAFGKTTGEVILLHLGEYPEITGFKSATLDENEQCVVIELTTYQGSASLRVPLVTAAVDLKDLASKNRGVWFAAHIKENAQRR